MTQHKHHHASAEALQSFTLVQALFGRRSRRFGVGMSIPDGPLAYTSKHPPQPLSELERTLLILAGAGVSGLNLGMPYTESGAPDTLCNYPVRPIGRTFPSGAATYGSELLITDDSGSYITRLRDRPPPSIRTYRDADDLFPLVEDLRGSIVRLGHERVPTPHEYPHVSAHNRWVANRPGTTLFVPVGDQVDSLLNRLWITIGERRPLTNGSGRLLGSPEELIAAGELAPDRAIPLQAIEASSRSSLISELSIASYNIHLMMQAIGLGGWLFSGINPVTLLGGLKDEGLPGFGFRFAPGPQGPEPIGLDGLFEPLVPPYVEAPRDAAEAFARRKFAALSPGQPSAYRESDAVLSRLDRYPDRFVAYLGSVIADAADTFGRFPVTVPPVAIATFTQAQHIDLGFYDRFFGEGAYLETHANHQELWHGAPSAGEPTP